MTTGFRRKLTGITRVALMLTVAAGAIFISITAEATHRGFAPGDVFVAMRSGEVQWRHADGTLNAILAGAVQGKVEGLANDAAGNLYVTHYCADLSICRTGNTIEKFNTLGMPQGEFGGDYDCNPYSIVFDGSGRAYVGQADCSGDILEFSSAGALQRSFDAEWEHRGSAWIDLGNDGCTMYYTSRGRSVKRYNICTDRQLSDFYTTAALPGDSVHQLHVLPDGSVLVASDGAVLRLSASGDLIQTYDAPGEPQLWYGVAPVGDGTFWASNYGSSNVLRFDLDSGAVLGGFNSGTPTTTIKGLAVMPGASGGAPGTSGGGLLPVPGLL